MASLNDILNWFKTGKTPTEGQFQQTFSSLRHKEEKIQMSDIEGLEGQLNNKLGSNHSTDENAHNNFLAKKDSSNLSAQNVQDWRDKLGVGEIPENVALVDLGENQQVYNKAQIESMTLLVSEFIISGKIRADKIEALGITDLIESAENTLAAFAANSANYEFQKNDFIAVADVNGNYSLFMFKGGDKTVVGSYLPTGLSNITIAMVEGLQSALNGKLDKPTGTGGFFARQNGAVTTWVQIAPASYYLTLWDGSNFQPSVMYQRDNKIGIGTDVPTESIHTTGRIRAKAVVLDETAESLPNQITKSAEKYHGADSSGVKRPFQFGDYAAFLETLSGFSPAQNSAIANILGGGSGSPGNPSVNLISPPLVQNQYDVNEYIMLQGANLYLGTSSKVEILAADKTTVIAVIPDNQVQQYVDGLSLVFYHNFYQLPQGQYFVRITSGVKVYTTSLDINVVQQITPIDINNIVWDAVYDSGITPNPSDILIGNTCVIHVPNSGINSVPKIGVKSNELFNIGEDFYIELAISLSAFSGVANPDVNFSTIGLGYSNTPNSLSHNSLIYSSFNKPTYDNAPGIQNNGVEIGYSYMPTSYKQTIIKKSNLLRNVVNGNNQSSIIINNSGYSLFAGFVGRNTTQQIQIKVVKAFKFN
ncbi:hypothetical protein [Chryseobacterium sp.]|uniref:hypothetical protein n=1 Tax=Chryseobacterium sp. TaxID=1871047 RepID=UPI00289C49A4|nr:hypothetical protein [Chryseobacterium sp.]